MSYELTNTADRNAVVAAIGPATTSVAGFMSADDKSQIDDVKQPTSNCRVRVIVDRTRDIINFEDYAPSDTTTDTVAGWNKLFTDYPSGGMIVNISGHRGYTRINSTITPPSGCSNVELNFGGDGTLYNPDHGFTFLSLPATVAGWTLNKPRFFAQNAPAGSVETFAVASDSDELRVHNASAVNMFSGFLIGGPKNFLTGVTYIKGLRSGLGRGVVIDQGAGEIFRLFHLVHENASGQDALAGVHVISGNDIFVGGGSSKGGTPLRVTPTNGKIVATLVLDFACDTSSGSGAVFDASGTGVIQRVEGKIRSSSNAGDGVAFSAPPRSMDLSIRAVLNGTRGIYMATGDYHNGRIRANAYGNGTHGVLVGANSSKFTIEAITGAGDDFGGNLQYGLVLDAGCDHYTVDVDGVGDVVGLYYNGSGTGTTKVFRSRN